jgi:hypothetical protein
MGSNREELAKVTGLRIADESKYVHTRSSHSSSSRNWLRKVPPMLCRQISGPVSEWLGVRQRLRGLDVAVDNSVFVLARVCNPHHSWFWKQRHKAEDWLRLNFGSYRRNRDAGTEDICSAALVQAQLVRRTAMRSCLLVLPVALFSSLVYDFEATGICAAVSASPRTDMGRDDV